MSDCLSDPVKCRDCGRETIKIMPFEDRAECVECGFNFYGLPRNASHERDWKPSDIDNGMLWRGGESGGTHE